MTEQTTELATIPKAPLVARAGGGGLRLDTIESMWRFAECVAKSGLAPKGLDKVESIVVALEMGAEVGMPAMMALQNVAVINGKPSIYGDAQFAVARSSGMFDESAFKEWTEGEGDSYVACCTVKRKGSSQEITNKFSVADAKRAQLWGKAGPWQQYPKRMLMWRARSWCLRDGFNDILKGFPVVEEVADLPPVDVQITTTEPATPVAQQLADKAKKGKKRAKKEPEPVVEEPPVAPEPEPAPPEPGPEPEYEEIPAEIPAELPAEPPVEEAPSALNMEQKRDIVRKGWKGLSNQNRGRARQALNARLGVRVDEMTRIVNEAPEEALDATVAIIREQAGETT